MTGLEKKSDVVSMAAYAPLLVNTNNRGWNPDMIVFDNHRQEEPLICTSSLGSNLTLKILYRHSVMRGSQEDPAAVETARCIIWTITLHTSQWMTLQ